MSSIEEDEQYARDVARAIELSKQSATAENERRRRYLICNMRISEFRSVLVCFRFLLY